MDPDKILVGQIIDNKKVTDYLYQYKKVPTYYNRIEAIKFATKDRSDIGQLILLAGLGDQQDDLRTLSVKGIDLNDSQIKEAALKILLDIAKNDKNTTARAAAILKLAATGDIKYKELLEESIKNQSYKVIAAGIFGLNKLAPEERNKALTALDDDTKNHIAPLMKKFDSQK